MVNAKEANARCYRFGDVVVDHGNFSVQKGGQAKTLSPRAFDVLIYLLEHRERVMEKQELFEQVWEEAFVTDSALAQVIKEIRQAIGDDAHTPRYIETVHKRGYRFVAPVKELGPMSTRRPAGVWRMAVAALALLVLGGVLVALNVGGLRERLLGGAAPGRIASLAVLPLENLSGDAEQEYFVDGMTETLITELGKISALRVISRQSVMRFKGTDKPLPEIARELNVDALVEGAVVRTSPAVGGTSDRVRITVQLVRATPEQHLWAESYERDLSDLLALQGEVAQAIAREIHMVVTPEEQTRLAARPINPEAYEAYLKGRYFWNKRTEQGFKKGIEYFQQVIEKDPAYARAYAGLADSYNFLGTYDYLPPEDSYPRGRAAATKAIEIDETVAEAHASLAVVLEEYDRDWAGAEKEFKRAIELNPSYASAHQWYAEYLLQMGRHKEAIAEARLARELDPLSLQINSVVGWAFYIAGQYDASIEEYLKALEMDPNYINFYVGLGLSYMEKAMFEEAIAELQKAVTLPGGSPFALAPLGYAHGIADRKREALKVLNQLRVLSEERYISSVDMALVQVGLGENEKALNLLEKAYEEGAYRLTWLKVDPRFGPLRDDPRFQSLLRRMNFPED
jgi:TolB-like protein/DNA-binding winged helix-turn-helix (wHTH) protein/Flp pilus assembly protein TadD